MRIVGRDTRGDRSPRKQRILSIHAPRALVRETERSKKALMPLSKENVTRFLDDTNYSHRIDVLLPALLSFTEAPDMGETARGDLTRLRGLRNEIAHDGTTKTDLTKKEAAGALCAETFGFHYIHLAEHFLEKVRQSKESKR